MEALDKRLTGLRGLFRTLTVQSEFKDNLVAQMQREFDEVRAIFRVQPGGATRSNDTVADELSDELSGQNAVLRRGLDILERSGSCTNGNSISRGGGVRPPEN